MIQMEIVARRVYPISVPYILHAAEYYSWGYCPLLLMRSYVIKCGFGISGDFKRA